MNSKGTIVAIVIVVLLVIVAGFFLMHTPATTQTAQTQAPQQPAVTNTVTVTGTEASTSATAAAPAMTSGVTITYTDSGFSPASVTMKAGEKVTFINKSSERMWVASDPHPVHTGYDGTSVMQHCANRAPKDSNVFDECTAVTAGGTFTFMPTKVGTWGYHNHANDGMHGTITVTAS